MKTNSKSIISIIILLLSFICFKKENIEPEVVRTFTKSIERISVNNFEKNLIEIAEKYYPPREDVIKAAYTNMEIPASRYWFYANFDGVYLPFAITIDAIKYYSDLIDDFNFGKKVTFFLSTKFEYKAQVTYYESFVSPASNSNCEPIEPLEFNSVYMVKMNLKWDDYCRSLCA